MDHVRASAAARRPFSYAIVDDGVLDVGAAVAAAAEEARAARVAEARSRAALADAVEAGCGEGGGGAAAAAAAAAAALRAGSRPSDADLLGLSSAEHTALHRSAAGVALPLVRRAAWGGGEGGGGAASRGAPPTPAGHVSGDALTLAALATPTLSAAFPPDGAAAAPSSLAASGGGYGSSAARGAQPLSASALSGAARGGGARGGDGEEDAHLHTTVAALLAEGFSLRAALLASSAGLLAEMIDAVPAGAAGGAAAAAAAHAAAEGLGPADPAATSLLGALRGSAAGPPATALRAFTVNGARGGEAAGGGGGGGSGGEGDGGGGSGDEGGAWGGCEEEGGEGDAPETAVSDAAHHHPTFFDAAGSGEGGDSPPRGGFFPSLRSAFLLLPTSDAAALVQRLASELAALVQGAVAEHREWLAARAPRTGRRATEEEPHAPAILPPTPAPAPAPAGGGADAPSGAPVAGALSAESAPAPPPRGGIAAAFFSVFKRAAGAPPPPPPPAAGAAAPPPPPPPPAPPAPAPEAVALTPYAAVPGEGGYLLPRAALAALLAAHAASACAPAGSFFGAFSAVSAAGRSGGAFLGASAASAARTHHVSALSARASEAGGGGTAARARRELPAFFHVHAPAGAAVPRDAQARLPYRHPRFPLALLERARLLVHLLCEPDGTAAGGVRARARAALTRVAARALRRLPPLAAALPALHTADNALLEEAAACLAELGRLRE
jgi:hypothetical protein